jgi:hypothetical protein
MPRRDIEFKKKSIG